MILIRKFLLALLLLQFSVLFSQTTVKDQMSAHVYFLADDRLEGRQTGSEGEKLAMNYIASYFKQYGLLPKGEKDYIQSFTFTKGKSLEGYNSLFIDNHEFEILTDFFPLPYSGNGNVKGTIQNLGYGIEAPGLLNNYEGIENLTNKILLINLSSPDGIHPHSKYINYTDYKTRIKIAESKGASAIIFYNTDKTLKDPVFDLNMNVEAENIPVIFIQSKYLHLLEEGTQIELNVNLKKEEITGSNVVGFINNKATNTVVIGAHYDHIGHGEYGNSRSTILPAIHNGADDNASGVALMLELSKYLKEKPLQNNNYLFVAFSGEELGLFGSKYFTQNPTIDLGKANYMLNFDMVGRLDEQSRIALHGVGTSPTFEPLAKSISTGNLNITTSESGMGASDHTSFYLKDLPVLHFYTGNNPDYHKDTDDAHLINYDGMVDVLNYTYHFMAELDTKGKLEFTKTKDTDNKNNPKFSVTLGVIPDYMFSGKGMRLDGISEGKPAQLAGIKGGDIVVKIGHIDITDMMSYMTALSKFEKGAKTIVVVERNGDKIEFPVEF
jgi:aminopeptidase YwaD